MFHSDYKHITDRLPDSLIKRAYQGLLNHSKNPVSLEMISGKSGRIESYLRHKLEVYENSLNRKRKNMAQSKLLHSRSWPKCNVFPATDNITCNHEEENNQRVMNELKVLSQHLLDYNKRTFEKFMQDVNLEYNERVNAKKKIRYEIEDLKMQVQEAEKELASMKSDSTRPASKEYPNLV